VDLSLTERGLFRQVNRAFHDVILSSPLIQHKLDLHAAGFEYNPAAGIDLAESRKALHQYLSNLDLMRPVEQRTVRNLQCKDERTAGGIITVVNESVRLFTLGSSSRQIPHKEWEIPLPTLALPEYGFYPGADIIAFAEVREVGYVHWLSKVVNASSP